MVVKNSRLYINLLIRFCSSSYLRSIKWTPWEDLTCSKLKWYMGECSIIGGLLLVVNMDPGVMAMLLCQAVIGQACMDVVRRPQP